MSLLINMHEIYEGDKIKDNIGGDDVSSAEESEMGSSTDYINDNDNLVSGFDASTCSGDNVYDIFENDDEIINKDSIVWVYTNKRYWEWRIIKFPYSDLPQDSNYLKLKWINTKKKYRVLIKKLSREYKQNIIPISTQKYKYGGVMEKYVLDLTTKTINKRKGMTKTEVNDVVENFVAKLRGLNIGNNCFIQNYL